jgi:hypothetical protein
MDLEVEQGEATTMTIRHLLMIHIHATTVRPERQLLAHIPPQELARPERRPRSSSKAGGQGFGRALLLALLRDIWLEIAEIVLGQRRRSDQLAEGCLVVVAVAAVRGGKDHRPAPRRLLASQVAGTNLRDLGARVADRC